MQDEQVTTIERLIADLEAASSRKDVDALVALFAPDATIESYLVSRVLNRNEGVARGRAEIRELVLALMRRGTPWDGHEPPIIRGNTVAIEYRSASSATEKFSVDIIEVSDGKIQSLRAYAGWRAVMSLTGGPVAAADASSKSAAPERIAAANKELLRRFYKEVYVDWNMALVDEVVSPEFMSHDWPEDGPTGPQAFRDYYSGLRSVVPDARYEVDDLIAEGDRVVVRWRLLGTHQGEFQGIAPTGRAITLKGVAIYRVDDGKLMERWVVSDVQGVLEELRGSSPY